MSQKYFNSSSDKEQHGTQFMLTGVTKAQLSPLLKPCKFSYKTHFILSFKFFNALY